MSENKLCRYCLIGLTGTDASSDFCCEDHKVQWSGSRWFMFFRENDLHTTLYGDDK